MSFQKKIYIPTQPCYSNVWLTSNIYMYTNLEKCSSFILIINVNIWTSRLQIELLLHFDTHTLVTNV